MAKAFFIKTLAGLVPDDDVGREALRGLGLGEVVVVEVKRPRNLPHMRLYWAMCAAIADGIGAERESVSDVLKIKTGHFRTVQTKDGVMKLPKSISFSAMDQAAFNIFFDRCCAVIIEQWLPNMKAPEIRQQIEDMVSGSHHSANPTAHIKAPKRKAA